MKHPFRLNARQVLIMGLALLILTGTALLMLPAASKGAPLTFLDAVFTSASASCVTGLVLFDTYSQFTLFGQVVILVLIQIGGLGFMMVAIFVSLLLRRRIGLYERSLLMQSVGALQIGGVVCLTKRALIGTGILEGAGTLALATWFCPRFGVARGLWMSLFHAVSAFCNAGFDLMGAIKPGSSLTSVADVPVINVTVMTLIICGGLGFFLWDDLMTHKLSVRKYSLHTKLVLTTTAIFLVGGATAFYLLEQGHAFAGKTESQKWLMAAFQSVTPRTAGFNSVDMQTLGSGSTLLTIFLMFVGAGSGSTGGGIKVNTFAVMFLSVLAYAARRENVNVFHRRLSEETIHQAYAATSLQIVVCICGALVLCIQGFSMGDSLFEAFSAVGTVGLSRGITSHLSTVSKLAISLLMFFGRLGSLSVAMAVSGQQKPRAVRNISENILIG